MKLFVRNYKKGFATNSSSYHSTIIHYIDIPREIWAEFVSDKTPIIDPPYGVNYFRSSGVNLIDDEDYIWNSILQLEQIGYEYQEMNDGSIRITVETTDEQREQLKQRY